MELVDANGAVIARSDNSLDEANGTPTVGKHKPMKVGGIPGNPSVFSNSDFYSTNPKDAGMRVDLPGTAGSVNTYFVRVRASSSNLSVLTRGVTKGAYVLQVRLQELDEYAGSAVRYADIRYANYGVTVTAKPERSPLMANSSERPVESSSPHRAGPRQSTDQRPRHYHRRGQPDDLERGQLVSLYDDSGASAVDWRVERRLEDVRHDAAGQLCRRSHTAIPRCRCLTATASC